MRILISIFFVFTLNQAFFQPPENLDISCQEGIRKAIEDVSKGKYYLVSYGLIAENPKWWDKNDFTDEYLQTNFNINLWIGGCVVTEGNQCYSDTMEKLFDKKFGNNFFDSINPIIENEYKTHLYQNLDNDDYFPNSVDTLAILDFNSASIESYIKNNLIDSIQIPDGKVYVRFSVMKDGSTKDFEVIRGIDPYFDSLSIEAVKEIKVIKPAIFYGKEVNSRQILPINFVSNKKRKSKKN